MNEFSHIYPKVKTSDQAIGSDSMPNILNMYFNEPGTFLDIGGNCGNSLFFKCNILNPEFYTSLDVANASILEGKFNYPSANFIHWNRFNWIYNRSGVIDLPFPDIQPHNFAFANNVFNSTDFSDLMYTVESVWNKTTNKLIFSVYDKSNTNLWETFYNHMKVHETIRYDTQTVDFTNWYANNHSICYLKDNYLEIFDKQTLTPADFNNSTTCKSFLTGYDLNWLYDILHTKFTCRLTIHDRCAVDSNVSIVIMER